MTNIITNQGLQFALDRFFDIGGPPAALLTIGVDDGAGALAAATTTFNGTNVESNAFEITPTRSSQQISAQVLFGTGEANFTHRRIGLFNTAASTSSPLTGLYGGIDSLSSVGIVKDSDFSVRYIIRHTFANVGEGDNLVVNQGLQSIGEKLYNIGSLTPAKSMGWDDDVTPAYAAGDTSFTGDSAAYSRIWDATPTRSAQTVTVLATIPKGAGGADMNAKTIKRININNQTSNQAQTAGAITGLLAGISNQTIRKEVDYSLKFTVTFTMTSA